MKYTLIKQIRENDSLRNSYFDLAKKTFELSFHHWYQNNYWTDRHIPYVLVEGERVVSNVSVNVMDFIWQGAKRRYIQLGTVMTDPSYQHQGLCKYLMEEVLRDWKEKSDLIYLYANHTVLDFYPKFGFIKEMEYQYSIPISSQKGDFIKLDMEKEENRLLLKRCYEKSNPFSKLFMYDNFEIIMFYCIDSMKEFVYYSKKQDAICIAMRENGILTCFDIFCNETCSMTILLSELAAETDTQVSLGFTPKNKNEYLVLPIEEDDTTLFVLKEKETIFSSNKVMFPMLSHT